MLIVLQEPVKKNPTTIHLILFLQFWNEKKKSIFSASFKAFLLLGYPLTLNIAKDSKYWLFQND